MNRHTVARIFFEGAQATWRSRGLCIDFLVGIIILPNHEKYIWQIVVLGLTTGKKRDA